MDMQCRWLKGLLALAALICLGLALPSWSLAGGAVSDAQPQSLWKSYSTDQMIVKYRDPSLARASVLNSEHVNALIKERVNAMSAVAGIALTHVRFMSGDGHVLKLPNAMTLTEVEAIAKKLSADPGVQYAEPDVRMYPMLTPNDPQYANQWHYKAASDATGGVNLPGAWDITTGSSSIVVAVIDTGLRPHADIDSNILDGTGRVVPGYDFITDLFVANDGNGRDSDPSDPGDWATAAEVADPLTPCYTSVIAVGMGRILPAPSARRRIMVLV